MLVAAGSLRERPIKVSCAVGMCTLQYCKLRLFNHRVVTLVAEKLENIGHKRFALVLTNCIKQSKRQLPSSSCNHNQGIRELDWNDSGIFGLVV